MQGFDNPLLRTDMKGNVKPVAIEPSRQFRKGKSSKLDAALEVAKIRNLNAATAKDLQETQAGVQAMYGSNKRSKPA